MKANRPERPSVLYHGESQSREESKYLSRLRLYTNNLRLPMRSMVSTVETTTLTTTTVIVKSHQSCPCSLRYYRCCSTDVLWIRTWDLEQ